MQRADLDAMDAAMDELDLRSRNLLVLLATGSAGSLAWVELNRTSVSEDTYQNFAIPMRSHLGKDGSLRSATAWFSSVSA